MTTENSPVGVHARKPSCLRLVAHHPLSHLAIAGLSLGGGVVASSVLMTAPVGWCPLFVLSWMLTVYGARKVEIVRDFAVYWTLTGHQRWDRGIVECLTTLLLIQDFQGYVRDHHWCRHHVQRTSLTDSDQRFLRSTIWSPRFHRLVLWARLRANFVTAPLYRRLLAGGYATALVGCLAFTGAWLPWLVVWLIPIFPLYQSCHGRAGLARIP